MFSVAELIRFDLVNVSPSVSGERKKVKTNNFLWFTPSEQTHNIKKNNRVIVKDEKHLMRSGIRTS